MKKEIRIAPQNSIIFVMDKTIGEVPDPDKIGESLITATSSCIAIGTLCSIDGETHITLSDEIESPSPGSESVFKHILNTPSKTISVCTVLDESILEMNVQNVRTNVQISVNDPSEPDKIDIYVYPADNE